MRNARRRDGTGSPPRERDRGVVTGEPSALKDARWVRREAARKRPGFRIPEPDLAAQPTLSRPAWKVGSEDCRVVEDGPGRSVRRSSALLSTGSRTGSRWPRLL